MMMVIVTILAIVSVSYLQSKKVEDTAKWVSHTNEVLYHSETVLSNAIDNETAASSFALTGSVNFLTEVKKSQTVVYKALAALKSLTIDNTTLQLRIDSISALTIKQIEFSNRVIAARQGKGSEAASNLLNTGEGKVYMDNIRQLVYEVQADENIFLEQQKKKTEQAVTRLNTTLIILALLVLVQVVITYLAGRKFLATQRKLAEQKVRLNSNRLEVMEEQAGLGSWEMEVGAPKGRWSKQMFRLFGFEISDEAPSFEDYLERVHPEDRGLIRDVLDKLTLGQQPATQTYRTNPQILPLRYLMPSWHLEKDIDGTPLKFSGTLLDITERVQAEQKVIKANRLYFFISQINQMIVRMTDEKTLFKEACRIAVDIGKFKMAWIGIIDEETKKVIPVMYAGEERDYLSKIKAISVADVAEGRGPTGTALREGKNVICNDIETDPQMAPWKAAALDHGFLSSMAVPIITFGKVIGAFSFYASEKNFFDIEEIALLEEATGDVAFALEFFENEKMRKQAEVEVVKVYKENETTLNRISDAMVSVDSEWRYTFLNEAALATHPLGLEQTLGKTIWEVHPQMQGTVFWDKYHEAMETGKTVEIEEFYAPMQTWFSAKIYPSHDGLTIFYTDITERKNAEEKLTEQENQLRLFVEYSPAALAMVDKDMKYIIASKKWKLDYRLGDQDIIGKSHYEVFPEIPKEWKEIHQRCLAGAIEKKEEDPFVRADGRTDWVRWEIHPWRKASGDIGGLILLSEVITERKKAAEGLKKFNERFEMIARTTNDAIWEWNFETGELWANQMHQYLYGLTPADPVPSEEQWAQKIHPDDRGRMIAAQQEALSSDKSVWISEYRFQTKNDGYLDIYDRSYIIRNAEGKPIRMMGTMMDITERKRAEAALKEAHERLVFHLENSPLGYIEWDNQLFVKSWSKRAEEIFGWSDKEVTQKQKNGISLVYEEDVPALTVIVRQLMEGTLESNNIIHRNYTKSGDIIWCEWFNSVLKDTDGTVLTIMSLVQDITARKKVEQELAESENYLRTILQNEPECVKVLGLKGELISMNPAGLVMIEATDVEQVIGHQITELVNPIYRKSFAQLTKQVFEGKSGTLEFEITGLKGGHRWLETHAVPLKDREGKVINLLGVTRDITAHKKAAAEIINTAEQLRQLTAHLQSIREEERKRIGREIHDELGQQLTAIKMDISWIDKKIPDETILIKRKLKNIIGLLDGSNKSIRRILSELRPGILDDRGLIEAIEWLGRQFTENTGIPVRVSSTETDIKLSEPLSTCIFRVYQEALTNIMRYAGATKVETSFSVTGDTITVTIDDNGQGFDTAVVQSKQAFGILGMKERVASVNGKFKLDSTLGKGTRITITIPY